jgi:hypothetical protein
MVGFRQLRMRCMPDFLCIGLEKTGTTWLHTNLIHHPDVHLTPFKEIKYFAYGNFLPKDRLVRRFFSSAWHFKSIRNYYKRRIKIYFKNPSKIFSIDFRWDWNLFFGLRNDKWYNSLFQINNKSNKLSGEICPVYAYLDVKQIEKIYSFNPNFKIIIILRNPIERVWSKTVMNLCRDANRNLNEVKEDEFIAQFNRTFRLVPDYIKLINQWKKYFPDEKIFVGFYDMLCENPNEFFVAICNFLGIQLIKGQKTERTLALKKNIGLNVKIPTNYAVYLAGQYREMIINFCNEYNPYPQNWLKDIDFILNST